MQARCNRAHGRTSLSLQAGALRWSLLASLGLAPVACGGTVVTQGDGEAGSAQGGAQSGGQAPVLGGAGPIIVDPVGGSSPVIGGSGPIYYGGSGGELVVGGSSGVNHNLPPVCNDPQSASSQLVTCANGIQHRPKPAECPVLVAELSTAGASGDGDAGAAGSNSEEVIAPYGSKVECQTSGDCSAFHLGYCDSYGQIPAYCSSGCQTDSECGSGICLCNVDGNGGHCVASSCKTDADCGANSFCAPQSGICGEDSFTCLRREDACWSSSECPAGSYCADDPFSSSGLRACSNAVCGRPFLVEEQPRLADVVSRRDWIELELRPDLIGLSALERAELAAHYGRLGQMEHASIAAFARFSLQLLALGAPAELVEGCNRALIDETRHARLCFALASQYAGIAVGPGKLDIDRSCDSVALYDVAKLVISEGCIGETVAALDAMEQASTASDPVIHAVLSGIAADERNHAELAYRFLRWALARATTEEREALREEAELRLMTFEATASPAQRLAAREVARPMLLALFANGANNALNT